MTIEVGGVPINATTKAEIVADLGLDGVDAVANLFKTSAQGLWLDIRDTSTIYQDNLGATPITANGQTVGMVKTKSGGVNHASNATTAQRPVWQPLELQGDYVDDALIWDGSGATGCESAYVTEHGWMVGGAPAGNYGTAARVPLGRMRKYVVAPNIQDNAAALSNAFGVDQYYFVGSTTDSTVFHRIDTPAGAVPITYIGANGATVTITADNTTTDLVAAGLTSPFAMLVPKSVGDDTALTVLWCHSNQLTGSIPDLSANTALTQFSCKNNQLTGSIPDLSANTALSVFFCHSNQLTGSIPDLSANTALKNFQCYSNQLTGSIPDLSANTALSVFYCFNNELTGSIPDLSANTALSVFYCFNNELTGVEAGFAVPSRAIDFRADDNALPEAAIDTILAAFATAGYSGAGTKVINLSGGTNAAPSVTGEGHIDTLRTNGWTVTVTGGY